MLPSMLYKLQRECELYISKLHSFQVLLCFYLQFLCYLWCFRAQWWECYPFFFGHQLGSWFLFQQFTCSTVLYLVYYAPARVTSCCLVTQSKLAGLIQRNVVSVTSIYYYSPIIKCRVCTSSDCYEYNKARVTLHLNLIVFHLTDYYMCPIQPV